jgi:ribosomal protein S1
MKVFDMDSADEEAQVDIKKRDSKKLTEGSSKRLNKAESGLKVNRLKFTPASLGLFAISEVHPTYLIVNFTRNTKGFIALDEKEDSSKHFEVGQYVVASVISEGTSQFNVNSSGHQNKKI